MLSRAVPRWPPTSSYGIPTDLYPPSSPLHNPINDVRTKRPSPAESGHGQDMGSIATGLSRKRPRETDDEDTILVAPVQHSQPSTKRKRVACSGGAPPCRDHPISRDDTLLTDTPFPNEGPKPSTATFATGVPTSTPSDQLRESHSFFDEASSPTQSDGYSPTATLCISTGLGSISSPLDEPGVTSPRIAPRCSSPLSFEDVGEDIAFDNEGPFDTRGHFCDLFLGTHRNMGRVALKRLRHRGGDEDDMEMLVKHFKRESNIWIGLQHPHILKCFGAFTRDRHLYLVSPFMKNGTLFDFIQSGETSGLERLRLIHELSDAIRYLHSSDIVHGDVKANNVLMSDDLHVQLCDFGLTKLAASNTATSLKGAGSVRWQAPELWDNNPKTLKSDVYAYSMTIVEVLTGQPPFADMKQDTAVMMAVHLRDARPVRAPETSLDGTRFTKAWDVAEMCWCQSADKRISMGEAAELLRVDAELENAPSFGELRTGLASRLSEGPSSKAPFLHQIDEKRILHPPIDPNSSQSPLPLHRSPPSITSRVGAKEAFQPLPTVSDIPKALLSNEAAAFGGWDNRDGRCPIRPRRKADRAPG